MSNGHDAATRRYVLYAGAIAITITTCGLLWNTSNVIGSWFYRWAQAASAERFEKIDQRIERQAVRDSLRFEEAALRDSALSVQIRHIGSWAVVHANDSRAHRATTAPP